MKKLNPSYLLFFAGILWLFAGIISEEMKWSYALGCAFLTLGIVFRKKEASANNSEEVSSTENGENPD